AQKALILRRWPRPPLPGLHGGLHGSPKRPPIALLDGACSVQAASGQHAPGRRFPTPASLGALALARPCQGGGACKSSRGGKTRVDGRRFVARARECPKPPCRLARTPIAGRRRTAATAGHKDASRLHEYCAICHKIGYAKGRLGVTNDPLAPTSH